MKKKMICLMIAGLSLFASPIAMNAGTLPAVNENTEASVPPVVTPAMEKKIEAFKKKHPEMFSKKENKNERYSENAAKTRDGGVLYISGGALILIIILLIILL